MPTMRAAQFHRYGGPEVITTTTVPVPRPGRGQVLVRVRATSVNGGEVAFRAGRLRLISGRQFPRGLGMDFAGEVAEVGPGVRGTAAGDRVWGVLDSKRVLLSRAPVGAAAEFLAVDAERTARLPAGLDFGDAVALLAGSTALTALRDKAGLEQGERLLVRGGTGGVGHVGVQLGRAMGAHVTTLVSARNVGTARELGADRALDYATTGPADLDEFDVVLDTVGSRMADYRGLLAPGGRMVTLTVDPPLRAVGAILASTVHGRRRIRTFSGNPTRALLTDNAARIESDGITALVAGTYPLEEVARAHAALEGGGAPGKHVVLP